jgi:hypothetical protein
MKNITRPIWVVENAARGVLMEWVPSDKNWPELRPRFSYNAQRTEGIVFLKLEEATAMLNRVLKTGTKAYIVELGKNPESGRIYDKII